jgi:hypothetical protein
VIAVVVRDLCSFVARFRTANATLHSHTAMSSLYVIAPIRQMQILLALGDIEIAICLSTDVECATTSAHKKNIIIDDLICVMNDEQYSIQCVAAYLIGLLIKLRLTLIWSLFILHILSMLLLLLPFELLLLHLLLLMVLLVVPLVLLLLQLVLKRLVLLLQLLIYPFWLLLRLLLLESMLLRWSCVCWWI